MKPFYVFDIEADGLLDTISKIHCLSYKKYLGGKILEKKTLLTYEEIREFFKRDGYFVGHNIIRYDFPAVFKVLGTKQPKYVMDTLSISWYLYPYRGQHGLESWGEHFGVPKPEIQEGEWLGPLEGETQEEFITKMSHRCEEDVRINFKLFLKLLRFLYDIYGSLDSLLRLTGYLDFKMECLRDQEEHGIPLNTMKAKKHLATTTALFDEKTIHLAKVMPKSVGVIEKSKPKIPYKKDRSLSVYGTKWFELLHQRGLPLDTEEIRELPNPGSVAQIKEWLFMMGWVPETFKTNAKGEEVPQISLPFGGGICPSVQYLYKDEPNLEEIESYYMLRHRKGIFSTFLESVNKEGKIYATAAGFTNTLRLAHKNPVVNLPGVQSPFGKEVRECLTVPNVTEYIMCGSDVSGLESATGQHYIHIFDPEYVEDMRIEGYDPHTDIGVISGLMTKEDEVFYKWAKEQNTLSPEDSERLAKLDIIRGQAKMINFSCIYGAGPPKIAASLKCSLKDATSLHTAYWDRNKAVKQTAASAKTMTVQGQRWLYNPISGFWMFLKAEKDKFSTLNQSSGVYIFDSWLRRVRSKLKEFDTFVTLQYHDELLFYCKKEHKEQLNKIIHECMKEVNEEVNLNVTITVSTDWGYSYDQCH